MENCVQSSLTVANEMYAQLWQTDSSGKLSRIIPNTVTHLKKNRHICRVVNFLCDIFSTMFISSRAGFSELLAHEPPVAREKNRVVSSRSSRSGFSVYVQITRWFSWRSLCSIFIFKVMASSCWLNFIAIFSEFIKSILIFRWSAKENPHNRCSVAPEILRTPCSRL